MHKLTAILILAAIGGTAHAGHDELKLDAENALSAPLGAYQEYFEEPDEDLETFVENADLHLEYARTCTKALQAAVDGGLPADTELHSYYRTTKLADAQTICARVEAEAQKALDAKAAQAEAELAPYKKALAGDKLSLWLHFGGGFYGKGCKPISTPKQLAKAKSWYVILEDDNGAYPVWTTRQYKFKGSKLVVDGKERTGRGSFPPAKGCPA